RLRYRVKELEPLNDVVIVQTELRQVGTNLRRLVRGQRYVGARIANLLHAVLARRVLLVVQREWMATEIAIGELGARVEFAKFQVFAYPGETATAGPERRPHRERRAQRAKSVLGEPGRVRGRVIFIDAAAEQAVQTSQRWCGGERSRRAIAEGEGSAVPGVLLEIEL